MIGPGLPPSLPLGSAVGGGQPTTAPTTAPTAATGTTFSTMLSAAVDGRQNTAPSCADCGVVFDGDADSETEDLLGDIVPVEQADPLPGFSPTDQDAGLMCATCAASGAGAVAAVTAGTAAPLAAPANGRVAPVSQAAQPGNAAAVEGAAGTGETIADRSATPPDIGPSLGRASLGDQARCSAPWPVGSRGPGRGHTERRTGPERARRPDAWVARATGLGRSRWRKRVGGWRAANPCDRPGYSNRCRRRGDAAVDSASVDDRRSAGPRRGSDLSRPPRRRGARHPSRPRRGPGEHVAARRRRCDGPTGPDDDRSRVGSPSAGRRLRSAGCSATNTFAKACRRPRRRDRDQALRRSMP